MNSLLPFLNATPGIDLVADELIERCQSFSEALGVARALARRRLSDGAIAAHLGVQRSVWSRIQHKPANSPAYMPEDKFSDLCEALGNAAVVQWLAKQVGCRLVPIGETRKQRLERELAEITAMESA